MAYDDGGKLVGTGTFEELAVQLVFRAVGYRSVALPGVPFDERNGLVPNAGGRVLHGPEGPVRAGEYVAGWVKRGPQGVIGTNKQDAAETVAALLADIAAAGELPARPELAALLTARGVPFVDWEGWSRIDARERELGAAEGRERVKISALTDLLDASR